MDAFQSGAEHNCSMFKMAVIGQTRGIDILTKIKNKNLQNKNRNGAQNGEKLRTARLKSKFTGSYIKKMSVIHLNIIEWRIAD